MADIALLHPGDMGVTVGRTLMAGGHGVRWLSEERSETTRQRAAEAGFRTCRSLEELLEGADAVVSVCPPAAAVTVAERVAGAGFPGWYLDANAVAPGTARHIAGLFGDRTVDGGIVGPPARRPGTTRLYLSGPGAAGAAAWFAAGPLQAVVLDGPAGAASALKMCYAAYTKGSTALVLAVRALAEAEGVAPALLSEWSLSQPGLAERSQAMARGSAPKAWRFVGEMHEIAATFDAVGLPDGFHRAAAEIYQRIAATPAGALEFDVDNAELAAVLARLLAKS